MADGKIAHSHDRCQSEGSRLLSYFRPGFGGVEATPTDDGVTQEKRHRAGRRSPASGGVSWRASSA